MLVSRSCSRLNSAFTTLLLLERFLECFSCVGVVGLDVAAGFPFVVAGGFTVARVTGSWTAAGTEFAVAFRSRSDSRRLFRREGGSGRLITVRGEGGSPFGKGLVEEVVMLLENSAVVAVEVRDRTGGGSIWLEESLFESD